MGFWHTGYIEHHEEAGLGGYDPRPPVYSCLHCSDSFSNRDELLRHRFQAHPYVTPILFVRGREIGATPVRVSRPLDRLDVSLTNCSSARINNRNVPVAQVPDKLAALRNDHVSLELTNEGGSKKFQLKFSVPEESDLAGVECAFVKLSKGRALTIATINSFIADCSAYPSADSYFDGICHYLYGVLAKERSADTSLEYSQYQDRFNRASDALIDFDRNLAHRIRALVAFNFNHFLEATTMAGPGSVKFSAQRFARILSASKCSDDYGCDDYASASLDDILADNETRRIIFWAQMPASRLRLEADEISSLVKREGTGFDAMKLKILLMQAYLAAERIPEARKVARGLLGYSATSSIAKSILEDVIREEVQ